METVTIRMSKDERDYIAELLLKVATETTDLGERMEILDVIVTLMKGD